MSGSNSASFVFRLWLEASLDGDRWRWHALHVQSGEEAYLSSITEVLAFVARQSEREVFSDMGRREPPGDGLE